MWIFYFSNFLNQHHSCRRQNFEFWGLQTAGKCSSGTKICLKKIYKTLVLKKKKKPHERSSFKTQLKIEFLFPHTRHKKVLENIPKACQFSSNMIVVIGLVYSIKKIRRNLWETANFDTLFRGGEISF